MKHTFKYRTIWIALVAVLTCGCEDYLDKSPDMGLTEESIYQNFTTMLGFLDYIYTDNCLVNFFVVNEYENINAHPSSISDEMAAVFNNSGAHFVTSGNWLEESNARFEVGSKGKSVISKSYSGLRITNRVINYIDEVQVLTELERSYLLGQAYFLRAYFYFEIIRRYGGMPIFDTLISATDEFDVPRKTYLESHDWMVTDLDNAINYLPERWPTEHEGRPTKASAMALKAMAELYAASPLMQNDLNSIENKGYNKERAATAAVSAEKAIRHIEGHSYYRLMDNSEYRSIYLMPNTNLFAQPEYLWYNRVHHGNWSAFLRALFITQPFEAMTGAEGTPHNAPTQNMVDMFEKKGPDGKYYPITDPLSGYSLQDPYTDRDPRLSNNILVPGEPWSKDNSGNQVYVPTYSGGYTPNFLANNNFTNARQSPGYLCKKYWWPTANNVWQSSFQDYRLVSVYLRVAQVYLDFAEASFEATGSATAVVPGCTMSAVDALNIIRNRGGITDLPAGYVNDADKFRAAYRRERAVELMFENNRWFDIRRWMIAVDLFKETYPIKGIKATPKNHSYTAAQLVAQPAIYYELTEFDYEIVDVIPEVRNFQTRNYWYPLPMDDVASLENLQQNPGW